MSKERKPRKETRKKPVLSLKEKRAAKKAKHDPASSLLTPAKK
jgi:hypothetical protein